MRRCDGVEDTHLLLRRGRGRTLAKNINLVEGEAMRRIDLSWFSETSTTTAHK